MEEHNELLENTEEMKAAPAVDGGEVNESSVSTEAYEGHAEPEKVFCVKCGAEIEVQCDGADEEDALKKAIELIESGLGDEQ